MRYRSIVSCTLSFLPRERYNNLRIMAKKPAHLAIEIENHILNAVVDLRGSAVRRTVPLTTLVDNQRRALVRVFLVKTDRRVLLKEFDVPGLAPGRSGETRFLLSCDFNGRRTLALHLAVDGRSFAETRINLSQYLRDYRKVPIIAAAAAVLILLALLLLRTCGSGTSIGGLLPTRRGPEQAREVRVERVAPSEPAARPEPTARPEPAAPPEPGPPPERTPEPAAEPAPEPARTPEPVEPVERVLPAQEHLLYFRPDDPRLTAEALERLDRLARELGTMTPAGRSNLALTIRGHCALSGTEAGRIALSRERAENAAAFLVETGLVEEDQVTVEWYGAARLITRETELQHLNRRVEIVIHQREQP